jgi:GIY-YIG catalytic domain-containing protein
MITLHELFKNYIIDPKLVRLVRHTNVEIPVLEVFRNDIERFTEYCAWQRENKFGKAKYIAVFAPARGTTAIFLGLWSIDGVTLNKDLNKKHLLSLRRNKLPERWHKRSVHYHLSSSNKMMELSERLVIDWGKSTVSWVQSKDKDIIQLLGKNSIGDFVSYDDIQLSYCELQKLMSDSDSNISWINALSSVNGIYLIRDKTDGRLYVGSAYGKEGIWSRWKSYAKNGHGGNRQLKGLNPENLEFSVLEIASAIKSVEEVIERENRWKIRLGTRDFGLNDN